MKGLGIILAMISLAAMIFGMLIVKEMNNKLLHDFAINHAPYTQLNEQLLSWIIYGGGGVILIFGLFCIALDVALDRKTTRV